MTPLQCISKCRRGMLTGRSACRPDLRTVTSDHRSVYDRWNVVLVLEGAASNATLRKYTWGLDLSGWAGTGVATVSNRWSVAPGVSPVEGIHGAGGIGGLLAVEETATSGTPSYWFFYDANGNVGQLVSAADQSLAAHYEYDPYGNPITVTGTYAATNPFRFSTKWFDPETGLGYWGYRYYSPRLGRWMSRDPVATGGLLFTQVFGATGSVAGSKLADLTVDMYIYPGNKPTSDYDILGLYGPKSTPACRFACGQCFNKCQGANPSSRATCVAQWQMCHNSCDLLNKPGGGCGPAAPGPIGPPASPPWWARGTWDNSRSKINSLSWKCTCTGVAVGAVAVGAYCARETARETGT